MATLVVVKMALYIIPATYTTSMDGVISFFARVRSVSFDCGVGESMARVIVDAGGWWVVGGRYVDES